LREVAADLDVGPGFDKAMLNTPHTLVQALFVCEPRP